MKACSCRSTPLRVESRYFAKILRSKEAAAMIRSLFMSMQELNKGARRPAGVPDQGQEARRHRRRLHGRGHRLRVGAGRHRCGSDRPRSGQRRQGQGPFAKKLIDDADRQGPRQAGKATPCWRASPRPPITTRSRIAISSSRRCSRIASVKAQTYAKAQPLLRDGAIYASNTSTLPITSLAEMSKDRQRSSASISSRRSRR